MVTPGTLTLEESPGHFSQLDGPSQVRVIKLCDRIAYVFELFAEYDDFANSEEVGNAAFRKFKNDMVSLLPVEPTLSERVVSLSQKGLDVLKGVSPKRMRQVLCGESPSSSEVSSSDDEIARPQKIRRLVPS